MGLLVYSVNMYEYHYLETNVLISKLFVFCCKALEKLKRQLAEAEAAVESRKKPPEDTGPKIIGEGLVIDEWVSFT